MGNKHIPYLWIIISLLLKLLKCQFFPNTSKYLPQSQPKLYEALKKIMLTHCV